MTAAATRRKSSKTPPQAAFGDTGFGDTGLSDIERLQLGQFIPAHYHYQMLLDRDRTEGFRQAIARAVPEGGTVLELGGGTGILSYFAALRARKVWCVEQNPQLVETAKKLLDLNGASKKVEVIKADAAQYCPPERVDVVICEMLHSGLLREKQIAVIDGFKALYEKKFPGHQPTFIPEATILGVQPVQQDFTVCGYNAPIPMFFSPGSRDTGTTELSDPILYGMFEYRNPLRREFTHDAALKVAANGTLNALRFVTKNVLSIDLEKNTTVDWHNYYMVLPLPTPLKVHAGDRVHIAFRYSAGDSVEMLAGSLQAEVVGS